MYNKNLIVITLIISYIELIFYELYQINKYSKLQVYK